MDARALIYARIFENYYRSQESHETAQRRVILIARESRRLVIQNRAAP